MNWIQEAALKLRQLKSAIIASHVFPDPDALGSACGLALGMRSLGIEADVYLAHPPPEKAAPLLEGFPLLHEVPNRFYEAVIVIDTATKKRVGDDVDKLTACAPVCFNIDHHASNESWADVNYIDPHASASAELAYLLLKEMGARIEPRAANLLYAGIHDDTGAFRFSNTSAQALRTAAALVEAGADPARVGNLLYFSIPPKVLKLRGLAMRGLKLYFDGRLSLVTVTQAMLNEAGATAEDCDGLVEEARGLEGVECSALKREIEDGWKFSLRAKTDRIDVNRIAQNFGGGGHTAAAGYRDQGTAAEVEERLLALFAPLFE